MNAARRKAIAESVVLLEQAQEALDAAANEERDYYDSMPESIQGGEKGQKAEEAADALAEVAQDLGDIINRATSASEA